MKLKQGFLMHNFGDTQMMVAAGEAAESFRGLVRSNETAAFIVNCLQAETTADAIAERLTQEYDVTFDVALKDVNDILDKLNSIGALV